MKNNFISKLLFFFIFFMNFLNVYSEELKFEANSIEIIDKDKIVIAKDGVKILIDPKATMFLLGSIMDYRTDKLSARFVFDNPNEKSSCGCGESFSV